MLMGLSSTERRYTGILAAIYSFRLLGLFLILPVFSVYAQSLIGVTPFLMGITLGIYGFTQALFQIPLGKLSDQVGRKPILIAGLFIFVLGSLVAAVSNTITGVLIGRALQGGGAIGSTLIALLADIIPEDKRARAMSMIGMTIALSFMVAMIVAPVLTHWITVPGIFLLTAVLGVLGILLVLGSLPSVILRPALSDNTLKWPTLLRHPSLSRLNFSIFCLHAILTALFVVMPVIFSETLHFSLERQSAYYAMILLGAFLITIPLIVWAERRQVLRSMVLNMLVLLCFSLLVLLFNHDEQLPLVVALGLFFIAFIFLEAGLPSWVAKVAPLKQRGLVMGIYSTSQFLGIFFGGTMGGVLLHRYSSESVFLLIAILGMVWYFVMKKIPKPIRQSERD